MSVSPGRAGERSVRVATERDRLHLLAADPDLASGLPAGRAALARDQVVVPAAHLAPGPWEVEQLSQTSGVRGRVSGFLVIGGAITTELEIAGMVCTRLLAPGELVLLDGWENNTIPVRYGWTTLVPTTLAIFDDRLIVIGRRYPELLGAILRRAADQLRHALLQQAICGRGSSVPTASGSSCPSPTRSSPR